VIYSTAALAMVAVAALAELHRAAVIIITALPPWSPSPSSSPRRPRLPWSPRRA